MSTLRAAAATCDIPVHTPSVLGGGVLARSAADQEAPLRASVLLIEADQPVCLVSCDVLGLTRDVADDAVRQIADACGIPCENILVAATHSHHTPATLSIFGYGRDERFTRAVVDAAVEAARDARAQLDAATDRPNECEAELLFALGQEATVGQNSRWLCMDGQVSWHGHEPSQMVRPTGPHDVDLPVLALRRPPPGACCGGISAGGAECERGPGGPRETAGPGPDEAPLTTGEAACPTGLATGEDVSPAGPATGEAACPTREGALVGVAFFHGTRNVGTRELGSSVLSPGFFGLAAQALAKEHGAPFLFCPGASGSSQRPDALAPGEAATRVVNAVNEALQRLQPALIGPVVCLKRPFTSTYRAFDDAPAATDVRRWCERWFDEKTAAAYDRVFIEMRRKLAEKSGQSVETWLQVIRLGEVALVGVPGVLFASLGLEIKRRSPFRHTIVVSLANDWIGYLPDREAYGLGGYETWVGDHSALAPGTGEAIVEAALEMLQEAYGAAGSPACHGVALRPLALDDVEALQRFYNGLSTHARWFFRPQGWNVLHADCAGICRESAEGKRQDVVLDSGGRIVGWAFLTNWEQDVPTLGIGVADAWRGKGHGRTLMTHVIEQARSAGKTAIRLIHVKDNQVAGSLYRSLGFQVTGERTAADGNEYWEMELRLAVGG